MRASAIVLAFLSVIGAALAGELLVGRASVVDGDTIEIHGERVRFNGIDAPESWQLCKDRSGAEYRCGKAAADALEAFLAASRPTSCRELSRDRYKRIVAVCHRADGKEVNGWLVRNGHALDWPHYSKGLYAKVQAQARRERAGMWQGEFVQPWEARKARVLKPATPDLRTELLSKPFLVAQSWSCAPRKKCAQIRSCAEAQWYLANCSWGGALDRESDGIPCESIC